MIALLKRCGLILSLGMGGSCVLVVVLEVIEHVTGLMGLAAFVIALAILVAWLMGLDP